MLSTVGRAARDGDGPARRPDPGLLQHPGRQHLRDADPAGRPVEAQLREPASSCRPTWAAWCARARSPSGSTPTSRSSTSGVRRPNVAEVMNIIGDVEGRTCVIMDDIVDTANTLCKAAHGAEGARREEGRRVLHASRCCRAARSSASRSRTSTSWSSPTRFRCRPRPQALPRRSASSSCAQLLAETMTRICNEESVSSLFTD